MGTQYPTMQIDLKDSERIVTPDDGGSLEECHRQILKWQTIMKNQKEFCILAARWLPLEYESDETKAYWILYEVKTLTNRIITLL
jgi:hypothetical protein